MHSFTRRDFLRTSAAGAALATAPALLHAETPTKSADYRGTEIVALGKTGIKASRLAQGTGYNGYDRSSAHTRMGREKFEALLRHDIDAGITFIDMADLYGSHPYVKEVIKELPRDKFVLLSKIWPSKAKWVTPSGGAKEELDRFRKEVGVEYIDICLIHCMQSDKWPTEFAKIRDELSELKDKKVVRAVGVSCHDLGALKVASENPWVDVIFARINNKGGAKYSCDGPVEDLVPVLKTARKNGKAVVGMKIFGAGKLVQPEEKDASLKFVFENALVDAITIGMLKPEETDDTLKRMAALKVA